jgi:hypothetical protein
MVKRNTSSDTSAFDWMTLFHATLAPSSCSFIPFFAGAASAPPAILECGGEDRNACAHMAARLDSTATPSRAAVDARLPTSLPTLESVGVDFTPPFSMSSDTLALPPDEDDEVLIGITCCQPNFFLRRRRKQARRVRAAWGCTIPIPGGWRRRHRSYSQHTFPRTASTRLTDLEDDRHRAPRYSGGVAACRRAEWSQNGRNRQTLLTLVFQTFLTAPLSYS